MKNAGRKNKGFVILFSVMVSSIILAISLGVSNIALRELKFSTLAKDTNEAIFAANSGIECALAHDNKAGSTSFKSPTANPSPLPISCAGNDNIVTTYSTNALTKTGIEPTIETWTFVVDSLGTDGNECANITVTKKDETNTGGNLSTVFTSKGYNIADDACKPKKNSIERVLQVTY